MTSPTKENEEECIKKRDIQLASILSSIPAENQSSRLLEQIELLIEYLPCFDIPVIDEELLNIFVPRMKITLVKIYDDNFLLSDTADDDFVLNMIRENLKISYGFLSTLKLILEFFMTQKELSLIHICSIPVHTAQILLATFDHCKKSTELYKQTYNMELLELFRISQETHTIFINLIGACSMICDSLDNDKELDILREVLDILCEMSITLSDLNIKSMSNNWKGYMAIALKFVGVLKKVICLDTPIKSLRYQIAQNLASLDVPEPIEEKSASKILTITGFLIKVALKLLDLFWNSIESSCNQVIQFCLTILSYPPDFFESIGYPDDLINSMKTNVVETEQLIYKMYCELDSNNILSSCTHFCDEFPLGVVLFLNNYLGYILENSNQTVIKNTRLDEVIKLLFHCFSLCTYELYFITAKESLFDKLIINIAGSLLVMDNVYIVTEDMLLRNVLQENIFCALLAVEVWDLVLLNTSTQFQLETIQKLIKIHEKLDFGIHTYRPEASHFKFLLRRLFRNLSHPMKCLLTQTKTLLDSTGLWKAIGLRSFPEQQVHFVTDLCSETIRKIQMMDCDQFGLRDLICVGENLEILSTVSFSSLPIEQTKNLVSTIGILWSVTFTDFSNNMLRYFIVKLLRITATLITEFNVNELFLIFNTLKILAAQGDLKIAVCNVLKAFAGKNSNELSQDAYKIFTLVSHVIYPHLLNDDNTVVKQYVLEVIDLYYQRNKHDIVRELMRSSKVNQEDLTSYLERKVIHVPFEKAYFISLSKQRYRHCCVSWRIVNQPAKKFKSESAETAPKVEKNVKLRQIKEQPERKVPESNTQEEIVFDDIGDAIATLRSDVKALTKLLRKEKMTPKNVSALKLLTNELLSLL